MNLQKRKIVDLPWVYATAELTLGGKRYLSAISEARDGHAYIIDPETFEAADLWVGDTGVMNLIQIPGREQLLVITRFYPVFQSQEAQICLLTPSQKGYMAPWTIKPVMQLPFCHRIGIVQSENGLFVIGCQLCRDKDFQEDWSQPGGIWMAPIPDAPDGEWKLTRVFDGLTKNHGLFIAQGNQVYISCENGVLLFDMARYQTGQTVRPTLVTTTPTSDIWLAQGAQALLVGAIEPFHGDTLSIYNLTATGYNRQEFYAIHFGHVVWLGNVLGKACAIVGNRGGDKSLRLITLDTGETLTLDSDVGPTQITVYEDGGQFHILAANHGAGEVCLYTLTA